MLTVVTSDNPTSYNKDLLSYSVCFRKQQIKAVFGVSFDTHSVLAYGIFTLAPFFKVVSHLSLLFMLRKHVGSRNPFYPNKRKSPTLKLGLLTGHKPAPVYSCLVKSNSECQILNESNILSYKFILFDLSSIKRLLYFLFKLTLTHNLVKHEDMNLSRYYWDI